MRDTNAWSKPIEDALMPFWQDRVPPTDPVDQDDQDDIINPGLKELCEVELALTAREVLVPTVEAKGLYVLFSGAPFPFERLTPWSGRERRAVAILRHYLAHLKSAYRWEQALTCYRAVAERLRLYDVPLDLDTVRRRALSICPERLDHYHKVLATPPPFTRSRRTYAPAGEYRFEQGGRRYAVTIAPELRMPPPPAGHQLIHARTVPPSPLSVRREDLLEAAREMDRRWAERGLAHPPQWATRMERVSAQQWDAALGMFAKIHDIPLRQREHVAGMVSSGKSTFMEVLAFWAAGQGLHVTLVVGSVVGMLDLAERLTHVGVTVAPILGASRRERHINSLSSLLAQRSGVSTLGQAPSDHVGWRWLGTACMLDGLRSQETRETFRLGDEPCYQLLPITRREDGSEREGREARICPWYDACPRHQAERDMVDARVWLATPASLVYSPVSPALNAERLRMFELVARRSDLVIVDEADQVQAQLDTIFSPSQVLSGGAGAFFDTLAPHVNDKLIQRRRIQLRDTEGAAWTQAFRQIEQARDRIYELLQQESALSDAWVHYQYFTDKSLLDRIADDLAPLPAASAVVDRLGDALSRSAAGLQWATEHTSQDQDVPRPSSVADVARHNCTHFLNNLRRHKRRQRPLERLAQDAVNGTETARQEILSWLSALVADEARTGKTARLLDETAVRLEFALIVAKLAHHLDYVVNSWRRVEGLFDLEGRNSALVHRPPADYTALVPELPMGNVLGFQYTCPPQQPTGALSFFRCAGIGRWLLLHLDEMCLADGDLGPRVMLLSGTSWAGTSPHFHVQEPVTLVLDMPPEERAAIEESTFTFRPLYYPPTYRDEALRGQPIRVSGRSPGTPRNEALREVIRQLAERPHVPFGEPLSRLEKMRAQLEEREHDRSAVLLLGGSYDEVKVIGQALLEVRPDWEGQIRLVVPDDDTFDGRLLAPTQTLRRGDVARFHRTGAWIMVAPLGALERGHNILNAAGVAAFGAAYFLVRPHPQPEDITHAIHSINHWAVNNYPRAFEMAEVHRQRRLQRLQRRHPHISTEQASHTSEQVTLTELGEAFRSRAYQEWYRLMSLRLNYRLAKPIEREAMIWSQLVSIWQVIGRLVRGGSRAHVEFVDAAFALRTAAADGTSDVLSGDDVSSSLLLGMRAVLRPYCAPLDEIQQEERRRNSTRHTGLPERAYPDEHEHMLVTKLYGPLYSALSGITLREEREE